VRNLSGVAGLLAMAALCGCTGVAVGNDGGSGGGGGVGGGAAGGTGGGSAGGTGGGMAGSAGGGTGGGSADAGSCALTFGTAIIPQPTSAQLAPGASLVIPETGVTVRRISNLQDPGVNESQFTNGYSRWSAENVTGEYATAFGASHAVIYKLSDRSVVRVLDVTEPNELHWDTSEAAGTQTRIYYRTGAQLRRVDALTGTDALVHDFHVDVPAAGVAMNAVEGAPSRDARTWIFMLCASMDSGGGCVNLVDVVTYDQQADAIVGRLSSVSAMPTPPPNFVDVAPNGDRVVLSTNAGQGGIFEGPHAFDLHFANATRVGNTSTHSGWAWGLGGQQLFISQDDCSGETTTAERRTCDYVIAVDVNAATGWDQRVGVISNADVGWGIGWHFGRLYKPDPRGWAFMATEGADNAHWAWNQLFFFELVDAAMTPRYVRVSPTINVHQGYWSEAFGSVSFRADAVYWGGNWNGTAPLELYRAQLCPRWWDSIPPR